MFGDGSPLDRYPESLTIYNPVYICIHRPEILISSPRRAPDYTSRCLILNLPNLAFLSGQKLSQIPNFCRDCIRPQKIAKIASRASKSLRSAPAPPFWLANTDSAVQVTLQPFIRVIYHISDRYYNFEWFEEKSDE